ncbi:hypothetical protein K2Z84_05350 [Candidatus Binatia bacterium]|nr:hypothetical protein [Candidatus Binatia bacterium]
MKKVKRLLARSVIALLLAIGVLQVSIQPALAQKAGPGEPFRFRGGLAYFGPTDSDTLRSRVTDATGSGGGLVFATGPTISGGTFSNPTMTGTVTVPDGFLASIAKFASGILSGNGSKLATVTGAQTAGKQLTYDASGNVIVSSYDVGAAGTGKQILSFSSQTVLPFADSGSTNYLGLGGKVGASGDEVWVRAPLSGGTASKLRCFATGSTGGSGAVVTLGSGACGSPLTYPGSGQVTVTVTSTTAVSDTSQTHSVTDGHCVALKVVWTDTTTDQGLNCTLEYALS